MSISGQGGPLILFILVSPYFGGLEDMPLLKKWLCRSNIELTGVLMNTGYAAFVSK